MLTVTLIRAAGVWSLVVLAVFCPVIFLSPSVAPEARVVSAMMLGSLVLWIGGCGALMWRHRDAVVAWLRALPLPEAPKFVLAATVLACVEEAITTLNGRPTLTIKSVERPVPLDEVDLETLPDRAGTLVDEPDLHSALEVAALPGVFVELQRLF